MISPSKEQIDRALEVGAKDSQVSEWVRGKLIQAAMPNLSADDREYILTGLTPGEWDAMFDLEDYDEEFYTDEPPF